MAYGDFFPHMKLTCVAVSEQIKHAIVHPIVVNIHRVRII